MLVVIFIDIQGRVSQKTRLLDFAYQVMEYLAPEFAQDDQEHLVDIEIHRDLEDGCAGICYGDLEEVNIQLARFSGDHRYTPDEIALTLAHELVHARQFFTEPPGLPRDAAHIERSETEATSLETPLWQQFWTT